MTLSTSRNVIASFLVSVKCFYQMQLILNYVRTYFPLILDVEQIKHDIFISSQSLVITRNVWRIDNIKNKDNLTMFSVNNMISQ